MADTLSFKIALLNNPITLGRDFICRSIFLPAPLVQRATVNGIEATFRNNLNWAEYVDLAMAEQGGLLRCALAHLKRTPVYFLLEPLIK